MTPILARCTRCDSEFPLFAVVEDGTGDCPRCRQPLAAGDTGALLEWAAVADAAEYRLCTAIRFLRQTGGHLFVDWRSVVRSVYREAVGESLPVAAEAASSGTELAPARSEWRTASQPRRDRYRHLRMVWRRSEPESQ